ncbi:hypothetical protein Tco_0331472 [Tanacetum coccineum]
MIEKVVYNELSKRCSRLKNRCISLEIKLQRNKESFQNNIPSHNQDSLEFKDFFIINELQAQLEAKNVSIVKLKEHIANLKEKNTIESVQNVHNSNVVTSKVYKLDLPPLSPCIKNNMAAHVDYLKHTLANADILQEIIEDARELRPLDSNLASGCKFFTCIQDFLVYVSATCSSTKHVSDKLVVVTPMNKTRNVRKQTTNNSMSPSTGVSCSTEASRSKPRSNTKKDRIMQTSSNNKNKNKVEDQPRIAKSSLNNVNRISKTICNKNVKHSVLNANSELVCTTCHECMFDSIHDSCVRVYLNDVSASVKSKSVKAKTTKSKTKKVWKTTGKVFTNVGYRWIPIGQTFTLDGNTCPLTRFTTTKIVPPKKPTPTQVLRFLTTWNPCKTGDPMFLLLHLLPVSISGRTNRTLGLIRYLPLKTSTLITGVSLLNPSSSRIPTLPGYVANLLAIPALHSTLPIVVTFPLSLVVSIICYLAFLLFGDSTFSGGGDDEGSVAATRQDDMVWRGTVGGSTGARMLSSSRPSQFHSSSLSSSDDHYHNLSQSSAGWSADIPGSSYPLRIES